MKAATNHQLASTKNYVFVALGNHRINKDRLLSSNEWNDVIN